ncbi:hypothetical protein MMC21_006259 [Puttea exsequens]|nr:hypothetical protein [Puttea exsequens]
MAQYQQQQPPPPFSPQPRPQPQLIPQLIPPQQPYPPSPSPSLHVRNTGLPAPGIQILNPLTSLPLYTIFAPKRSHFSSDPHLLITSSITNTPIGSIRFHSILDDIDLCIHGKEVPFPCSTWSSSHEMVSLVGGGSLKWKNHNVLKGGDLRCTDGSGQVVARFEAVRWGKVQKEGKFELSQAVAAGGPAMDEIVISGIAMVEFKRREHDDEPLYETVNAVGSLAGDGGGGDGGGGGGGDGGGGG